MLKPLVGAVSILSITACLASAADLPARSAPIEPYIPPQVFTWTGFYIGGYAGYSFGSAGMSDVPFPGFLNGNKFVLDGATVGGLLGYNYQIGSAVIGVEGDIGYNGISSSQNFTAGVGNQTPLTRHEALDGGYIGRIRGRLGYAFGNFLMFGAGGLSFADANLRFTNPNNRFTQSNTQDFVGYNAGGGFEYAFNSSSIGRFEYIYDNLGTKTFLTPAFDNRRISLSENAVRAAFEYKF